MQKNFIVSDTCRLEETRNKRLPIYSGENEPYDYTFKFPDTFADWTKTIELFNHSATYFVDRRCYADRAWFTLEGDTFRVPYEFTVEGELTIQIVFKKGDPQRPNIKKTNTLTMRVNNSINAMEEFEHKHYDALEYLKANAVGRIELDDTLPLLKYYNINGDLIGEVNLSRFEGGSDAVSIKIEKQDDLNYKPNEIITEGQQAVIYGFPSGLDLPFLNSSSAIVVGHIISAMDTGLSMKLAIETLTWYVAGDSIKTTRFYNDGKWGDFITYDHDGGSGIGVKMHSITELFFDPATLDVEPDTTEFLYGKSTKMYDGTQFEGFSRIIQPYITGTILYSSTEQTYYVKATLYDGGIVLMVDMMRGTGSDWLYEHSLPYTEFPTASQYGDSRGLLTPEQVRDFTNKQDKLTAGAGIEIINNVISSTGGAGIPAQTIDTLDFEPNRELIPDIGDFAIINTNGTIDGRAVFGYMYRTDVDEITVALLMQGALGTTSQESSYILMRYWRNGWDNASDRYIYDYDSFPTVSESQKGLLDSDTYTQIIGLLERSSRAQRFTNLDYIPNPVLMPNEGDIAIAYSHIAINGTYARGYITRTSMYPTGVNPGTYYESLSFYNNGGTLAKKTTRVFAITWGEPDVYYSYESTPIADEENKGYMSAEQALQLTNQPIKGKQNITSLDYRPDINIVSNVGDTALIYSSSLINSRYVIGYLTKYSDTPVSAPISGTYIETLTTYKGFSGTVGTKTVRMYSNGEWNDVDTYYDYASTPIVSETARGFMTPDMLAKLNSDSDSIIKGRIIVPSDNLYSPDEWLPLLTEFGDTILLAKEDGSMDGYLKYYAENEATKYYAEITHVFENSNRLMRVRQYQVFNNSGSWFNEGTFYSYYSMPNATTDQKGFMTPEQASKLESISGGGDGTSIVSTDDTISIVQDDSNFDLSIQPSLDTKQNKLTEGTGISIVNDVISAIASGGLEATTIDSYEDYDPTELVPNQGDVHFIKFANGRSGYVININDDIIVETTTTLANNQIVVRNYTEAWGAVGTTYSYATTPNATTSVKGYMTTTQVQQLSAATAQLSSIAGWQTNVNTQLSDQAQTLIALENALYFKYIDTLDFDPDELIDVNLDAPVFVNNQIMGTFMFDGMKTEITNPHVYGTLYYQNEWFADLTLVDHELNHSVILKRKWQENADGDMEWVTTHYIDYDNMIMSPSDEEAQNKVVYLFPAFSTQTFFNIDYNRETGIGTAEIRTSSSFRLAGALDSGNSYISVQSSGSFAIQEPCYLYIDASSLNINNTVRFETTEEYGTIKEIPYYYHVGRVERIEGTLAIIMYGHAAPYLAWDSYYGLVETLRTMYTQINYISQDFGTLLGEVDDLKRIATKYYDMSLPTAVGATGADIGQALNIAITLNIPEIIEGDYLYVGTLTRYTAGLFRFVGTITREDEPVILFVMEYPYANNLQDPTSVYKITQSSSDLSIDRFINAWKRSSSIMISWEESGDDLSLRFYGGIIDYANTQMRSPSSGQLISGGNILWKHNRFLCLDFTIQNQPSLTFVDSLDDLYSNDSLRAFGNMSTFIGNKGVTIFGNSEPLIYYPDGDPSTRLTNAETAIESAKTDITNIVATIKSYATKTHGVQNLASMIVDYLNPTDYYAVKLDAEMDDNHFSNWEKAIIISVARIVTGNDFVVNRFGVVGVRLSRTSQYMPQNLEEYLTVDNPASLSSFTESGRGSQQYIKDKTDSWYVYWNAPDVQDGYDYVALDAIMVIRSYCTYTINGTETTVYGNIMRYEHKYSRITLIPEGELANWNLEG